jgi:hypothetical protein
MGMGLFGQLNWLAVGVAALAYFALGGVWHAVWHSSGGSSGYTPGGSWSEAYYQEGRTVGCTGRPFLAAAVAIAVALLAYATQSDTLGEAILLGLVLAIAGVAAALSGLFIQQAHKGAWFAVFTAYHTAMLLIVSTIVSLWR